MSGHIIVLLAPLSIFYMNTRDLQDATLCVLSVQAAAGELLQFTNPAITLIPLEMNPLFTWENPGNDILTTN